MTKDPNFALKLSVSPTAVSKLYSPTPNKLIGTAQYPRPKTRGASTEASPQYPSYMMKPNWHGSILDELQRRGSSPSTIAVYKQLFQDLPPASKYAQAQLEAVGNEIAVRSKKRELKPHEFKVSHIEEYKKLASDPRNKHRFFQLASAEMRDKSAIFEKDYNQSVVRSDLSDIRINAQSIDPKTSILRLNLEKKADNSHSDRLKNMNDFQSILKRKKSEKESVVELVYFKMPIEHAEERPIIKGTLGAHIPSPQDLFKRSRDMHKQLYPQMYIEKINKSVMMNSNRLRFEAHKKEAALRREKASNDEIDEE